jgi:hypothetical protein
MVISEEEEDKVGMPEKEEKTSGLLGWREDTRARQPNTNVTGPEWVSK